MQVIKPQIQKQQTESDTNVQKTCINIKQKFFDELVPLVLPLLKKHTRLGQAGIMDISINLSIPDF